MGLYGISFDNMYIIFVIIYLIGNNLHIILQLYKKFDFNAIYILTVWSIEFHGRNIVHINSLTNIHVSLLSRVSAGLLTL